MPTFRRTRVSSDVRLFMVSGRPFLTGLLFLAASAAAIAPAPAAADVPPEDTVAAVSIGGQALAHAGGLLQINQLGGDGNVQSNVFVLGTAVRLDDKALLEVAPSNAAHTAGATSRQVTVGAGAFAAPAGIVQLNQIAGADNHTANLLDIQLHP